MPELREKSVYRELNFASPAFSAGDYAIDKAVNAPTLVCGRYAHKSENYARLMLAACSALGVGHNDHVQGAMALPLEWAKTDGPDVCKRHSRDWTVDGISFRTMIETGSQGLLAVMNHAVDFDGRPLNRELLTFSITVDVGGGTTDVAEIRNGSVGNRKGSLQGCGINNVAERVRQELKARGMHVSSSRARKIVSDRQYLHRGVPVSGMSENIDRCVSDLADGVWSFVTERVPNESLQECEGLLLTGGAGKECYPYLKAIDPRFFCGEYPLYDNALGALKKAMRNKGRNLVYIGFDIGNSHVKAVRWMGDHVLAVVFRSVIGERIFEETAQ